MIAEAGWPAGGINLISSAADDAAPLATDPRLQLLTFTGSPAVGWELRRQAGRKEVALELGGNAGVILHEDADLDYALPAVVAGAFGYAGQSCISVQRVLVHENLRESFQQQLLKRVSELKVGDPLLEETDVGPMIDQEEATDDKTKLTILQKLGVLCADKLEDTAAANGAWRRVLEISPGHKRALRVLRQSYVSSADWEGLEDLYRSQEDAEGLADFLSTTADRVEDAEQKGSTDA